MPSQIFKLLKEIKIKKNEEIELTDGINKYLELNSSSVKAFLSSSRIFDCGSKKGFIGANIAVAAKNRYAFLYSGDLEISPGGGIGRHKGLKIPRRRLRAGSSPALGTKVITY